MREYKKDKSKTVGAEGKTLGKRDAMNGDMPTGESKAFKRFKEVSNTLDDMPHLHESEGDRTHRPKRALSPPIFRKKNSKQASQNSSILDYPQWDKIYEDLLLSE